MNGWVNFAELRRAVLEYRSVEPDNLLALIEAVDAARSLREDAFKEPLSARQERLDAALARFDFSDQVA